MNVYSVTGSMHMESKAYAILSNISIQLLNDNWLCRICRDNAPIEDIFYETYHNGLSINIDIFTINNTRTLSNFNKAEELVYKYYPYPDRLEEYKSLKYYYARNLYKILGRDLNSPSKIIIAYYPPERESMETIIAKAYNIPILNLAKPNHRKALEEYIHKDIFLERFNKAFKENYYV